MKILILADDFTGAMDTGCQFAATGLETYVLASPQTEEVPEAEVLVVNTESRHLTPGEAYRVTEEILRKLAPQCETVYIKTDSALRGNISAVLAAAVAVVGVPVQYVPSYPQVGRTMSAGYVYIEDDLLEHSVFARDPRSPMLISKAADIIRMDYPLTCRLIRANEEYQETPGVDVYLYDCESVSAMRKIAGSLAENGRMRLIGGCAGLAGALAPYIGRKKQKRQRVASPGALIVSGSANAVTFDQLSRRGNARMVNLAREEICLPAGVECLKDGESLILAAACSQQDIVQDAPESYHQELGEKIAGITEELLRQSGIRNLAVFGGDTVQAILKRLGCTMVHVLGSLEEGVPVCEADGLCLITKSGGLGGPDVVGHIIEYLTGGR